MWRGDKVNFGVSDGFLYRNEGVGLLYSQLNKGGLIQNDKSLTPKLGWWIWQRSWNQKSKFKKENGHWNFSKGTK